MINQYIDHTLLKADATETEIVQLIDEAEKYQFASVCIQPTWVKLAADKLAESAVKVCTVIGFPLGANTPETKAFEAKNAVANGADEIDMVINIGQLKMGHDQMVEADIAGVVQAAAGKTVKVIIETSLLTKEEKVRACQAAQRAGAQFVKTSTGFSTGGATAEDVRLMHDTVAPSLEVKASGGVRSYADAQTMIAAGATRIGASSGVNIVKEAEAGE